MNHLLGVGCSSPLLNPNWTLFYRYLPGLCPPWALPWPHVTCSSQWWCFPSLQTGLCRMGVQVTHCPWPKTVSTSVSPWYWFSFLNQVEIFLFPGVMSDFQLFSGYFRVMVPRVCDLGKLLKVLSLCPHYTPHGRSVITLPQCSQGQTYQYSHEISKWGDHNVRVICFSHPMNIKYH